jgi:hypothetical protein
MNYFSGKQFNMLIRMSYFLNNNSVLLLKKVPALKRMIQQYQAKYEEVRMLAVKHRRSVQAAGVRKKTVKENAIKAIRRLSTPLTAYARFHKKALLLKTVNYSRTTLSRSKSHITAERFRQIIAAAKRTKGIDYFGISAEHIQKAEEQYKEFMKVIELPALARSKKAASSRLLNKMMKSCIWILEKEIDLLVEVALEEKPGLLKEYFRYRKLNFVFRGRRSDKESRYLESRRYKPGRRKRNQAATKNKTSPSKKGLKSKTEIVAAEN